MNKTALIILHEGFEEMEAVAPIDILRRGEIEVSVVSVGESLEVTGRSGITIQAEAYLSDVAEYDFDCIILPGGPGTYVHLQGNEAVLALLKEQVAAERRVAAICAAPVVLAEAGLLEGKRYTAHVSTVDELPELDKTVATVVDGNIVTSQGAGTATSFALTVLAELRDEACAQSVAESICLLSEQ